LLYRDKNDVQCVVCIGYTCSAYVTCLLRWRCYKLFTAHYRGLPWLQSQDRCLSLAARATIQICA